MNKHILFFPFFLQSYFLSLLDPKNQACPAVLNPQKGSCDIKAKSLSDTSYATSY